MSEQNGSGPKPPNPNGTPTEDDITSLPKNVRELSRPAPPTTQRPAPRPGPRSLGDNTAWRPNGPSGGGNRGPGGGFGGNRGPGGPGGPGGGNRGPGGPSGPNGGNRGPGGPSGPSGPGGGGFGGGNRGPSGPGGGGFGGGQRGPGGPGGGGFGGGNRGPAGPGGGGFGGGQRGPGGGPGRPGSGGGFSTPPAGSRPPQQRSRTADRDHRARRDSYENRTPESDALLRNNRSLLGNARPMGGGAALLERPRTIVELPVLMSVKELADELNVGSGVIIGELMKNGMMATINQEIDYDTAYLVATDIGFDVREAKVVIDENMVPPTPEQIAEAIKSDANAVPRPPVVTIMGHVDHGKTKLLDAIRSANVAATEAGGITQHIGAYQVEVQGKKVTFLDTPGHEAFTAMRARGARATDIAVLVVAADDGVMLQTLEAAAHAQAAKVPIVVAVNKIDREGANPERIKNQLAEIGLVPEEWGGETPYVNVSAKMGIGITDLLDVLLLVAEIAELKGNPARPAVGTIIEARMDRQRGPLATVLIQNGTLNLNDPIVVGNVFGRVKALRDDKERRMRKAEPGTPAEILGLSEVPQAGDILQVMPNDETARVVAHARSLQRRAEAVQTVAKPLGLEDLFSQIEAGKVKEVRIILKADVQGSIEAITQALTKLSNDKVNVRIIYKGTGAIGESDVNLATASGAIIIGFNVRPDPIARRAADTNHVDIRFYNIIYNLIDDIKAAMTGMLDPTYQDVIDGDGTVRSIFRLPKNEQVAGIIVNDGKLNRNITVRVLRSGTVVFDGGVASLRRFKDDVREVAAGYECGVALEGFNDFRDGDTLEFHHREMVKPTA